MLQENVLPAVVWSESVLQLYEKFPLVVADGRRVMYCFSNLWRVYRLVGRPGSTQYVDIIVKFSSNDDLLGWLHENDARLESKPQGKAQSCGCGPGGCG